MMSAAERRFMAAFIRENEPAARPARTRGEGAMGPVDIRGDTAGVF